MLNYVFESKDVTDALVEFLVKYEEVEIPPDSTVGVSLKPDGSGLVLSIVTGDSMSPSDKMPPFTGSNSGGYH